MQVAGGSLSDHDLEHLLADSLDLGGLGVGGLLDLVGATGSETNGEQSEQVSIGGPHVHIGLNEGLPLADERPVLVRGHHHSVEVGEAVSAIDIVNAELELAPCLGLVLVQVTEGGLNHTSLKAVRRNGCTGELNTV